MRRITTAGAAAASLALLLTACSSGSETATTESSGAAPAAGGELLIWADEFTGPPMEEQCKKFADANGVSCKVVVSDDVRAQVVQANTSGDVPDLFSGAHDWLGELTANGVVAPVDLGANAASFDPVALSGVTYDGTVFGVPFAIENVALLTNKSLSPECPATLDEAVDNGLALKKAGKVTLPLALQIGETGDPYHWYPLFTADGGYIFGTNADGSYNPDDLGISGPGGVAAADRLGQLADEGVVKASVSGDIALETFAKGKSPYWITGPWNLTGAKDALGDDLMVCPVPNWENPGVPGSISQPFTGVQTVYQTAKAKNAAIAATFLSGYVETTEFMDAMYAQNPRPPAWLESAAKVASDPLMNGFIEYGKQGYPMPAIPAMASVWGDLGLAEYKIASGSNPEKTITEAGDSISTAIASAG